MFRYFTEDYEGEMVSEGIVWSAGKKDTNSVWIPKTIINDDHPGVAHIIGNGLSRSGFDLELLHGQRGGEGGVQSVGQTYGCNLLYTEFTPTFLICVNKEICKDIADSTYAEENIVYTTAKQIIQHPDKFHLFPYISSHPAGTLAAWVACADGHTQIYMLGFDFYETGEENVYFEKHHTYSKQDANGANNKFTNSLTELMSLYPEVSFNRVVQTGSEPVPDDFNWAANFEQITYREYISRTSIGAVAR